VYRVLLIVIALILYGCFFPWDFHWRELPESPVWMLLDSWETPSLDRFAVRDIIVNIVLYLPLGMFAFLAFSERHRPWVAGAASLLVALVLSSSVEMLQLFDRGRECSALDVVTNVMGAAAGIALAILFGEILRRTLSARVTDELTHPSGALLLVYCWLGWQMFPFFPAFSRTAVRLKLAALLAAPLLSPLAFFGGFVQWLAVAWLIGTVTATKKLPLVMAALIPLLPLRLVIFGRTFTWSELAGACAACLVLRWIEVRTIVVAGLFILALALRGIAPFHLQGAAASFSWIPFRAFLESDWISGLRVLLEKSFWYGTAVWLVREAGVSLLSATTGVCLLLAAVEAVQVYLPGRTPEITDPLLAAILAVILWLLEHRRTGGQVAK
jgi:VanZ family protein